MDAQQIISLQNITKKFRLYNSKSSRLINLLLPGTSNKYDLFTAVDNVSVTINKGEIVGIVGKNGSGKSTLLRVLTGITKPTSGSLETKGKMVPLFELGAGFHRELSGRENLYYYTVLQNFDKEKTDDIIQKSIEFADIGPFIDQPIRTYSRGMRSRLAFSISIYIDADILVLDEVMAVGDNHFKLKSYDKMMELLQSGMTIIMVSHSEKEILKLCSRALLMEKGKIIMDDSPEKVFQKYKPNVQVNESQNV